MNFWKSRISTCQNIGFLAIFFKKSIFPCLFGTKQATLQKIRILAKIFHFVTLCHVKIDHSEVEDFFPSLNPSGMKCEWAKIWKMIRETPKYPGRDFIGKREKRKIEFNSLWRLENLADESQIVLMYWLMDDWLSLSIQPTST